MDALRARFGTLVEWVVAAAFLALALAMGSSMLGQVLTVASVTPVSARDAQAAVATAGVPSGAVSVPLLLLPRDRIVRLGDSDTTVVSRLGANAEAGPPSTERGPRGLRLTQFYQVATTRFVLVFEPAEDQVMRVAAIYLR